jgi:hypothetical protein
MLVDHQAAMRGSYGPDSTVVSDFLKYTAYLFNEIMI